MKKTVKKSIKTIALVFLLICCRTADAEEHGSKIRTGEEWGIVNIGGTRAGYTMEKVEAVPGGYLVTDYMRLVVRTLGADQTVEYSTTEHTDASFVMKSFEYRAVTGPVTLGVKGEMAKGLLNVAVSTGGNVQEYVYQVGEAPRLAPDLDGYILSSKHSPGTEMNVRFFDTDELKVNDMHITVEAADEAEYQGMPVPALRIRQSFSGVTLSEWLSEEYGPLRAEGPMGIVVVRATKEQALAADSTAPEDLTMKISIPAGKDIPQQRSVRSMRVRLSGGDTAGLPLNGDGQEYAMGVVTVRASDISGIKPVSLPVTDNSLSRWLEPEPYIQSKDSGMKAKTAEILKGETDALKAARLIEDWLFRNLAKKPSVVQPSAAEVLKTLSGDCNEHTVLYIALARAAGLPAREADGIVLMDGRFYYHAWPEVYVGSWIAVDPTFGMFPADAARVRLVHGGDDRQLAVVNLFGKLKVEILDWK